MIKGQEKFLVEMTQKHIIWDPENYKITNKSKRRKSTAKTTEKIQSEVEEMKVLYEDPLE